MNSEQATNTPGPVTLAGREFLVRQLSHKEWSTLQAWLRASTPSPVAEAIRGLQELAAKGVEVPEELRKWAMSRAHEEARYWPPRVGSLPWFNALNSFDGGPGKAVSVVLTACGHETSEEEGEALFVRASAEEMGRFWVQSLHGDPPGPKATTGSTSPTTPPTPTNGAEFMSTSER